MSGGGSSGSGGGGGSGSGGWLLLEGTDVTPDEKVGRAYHIADEGDVRAMQKDCLELGFGGFVVKKGLAQFRPFSRTFILEHKTAGIWDRGSVLHVTPPEAPAGEGVLLTCGSVSRRASPEQLAARSGYFASLYRHTWADAEGSHAFVEFPGGERAFSAAAAWLASADGAPVGEPWPLRESNDVCAAVSSAAYLLAPRLLRAAVRSWNLATERCSSEQLRVAAAIVEASLQFQDEEQDVVIAELRDLLHNLPRHQLALSPDFLLAPAAGLAVLESRHAARETLVGHIKNVGGWVGSVISGSSHDRPGYMEDPDVPLTAHEFAVRLFDQHEAYFLARPAALQQLLCHLDVAVPIVPPLCFRVASAAAAAAGTEEEDGERASQQLAVAIFERSLSFVECPAEAAADPACVSGLFGAGRGTSAGVLGLQVLARELVPPAAASVVLSRVLSSWAAGESCDRGTDAADIILAGVVQDRQNLRTMLTSVLPRIAEEGSPDTGTDWGNSFEYAVPELRAAFARAVGAADAEGGQVDDTIRLLFRVLFQPTAGLPGLEFPLTLLGELRSHNAACAGQAAACAVSRLRELFARDARRAWRAAEETWPLLLWDTVDEALVETTVAMLKEWLTSARRAPPLPDGRPAKAEAKAAAARLLLQLPLQRLQTPEQLLGPPVPAFVLAALANRGALRAGARIAELEAENKALQEQVARLSAELRRSS